MWIVWTLLGVLIVYGFYALVASKLIRSMRPKRNKCKYCIHKENGVCNGVDLDTKCLLQEEKD